MTGVFEAAPAEFDAARISPGIFDNLEAISRLTPTGR
jgi:hypothetical protein